MAMVVRVMGVGSGTRQVRDGRGTHTINQEGSSGDQGGVQDLFL